VPLRLAVIAALLLASANQASAATSEHLVFISNRDGDRDVYAVNPDGSHLVALTRNKSFERAELSPDGRRLVVARSTGTFRTALVAVTPDGRHERVLASGENVGLDGFSRDGRWIAYHQGSGVRVVRFDGSDAHVITSEEGSRFVDWSPDSNRLLVSSANADLVVFTRDGTRQGIVAHGAHDAAWGERGIAVVTDDAGAQVLSLIDPSGNVNGLLHAPARRVDLVGWSPDQRRVAAITHELGGDQLATYWDVVSGTAGTLVSADYVAAGAWSPDGKELAIVNSPRAGNQQVDVFELPSTRIGTIAALSGYAIDSFAWSPSGRRLAFASGSQLFTAAPQGTGREWLTDRADAELVGWSPGPVPKAAPRTRPLPRPETATVTLLQTHAPIAEIASDGYWAAAVVLSDRLDCTHVAAWRAGTSKTLRFQFIGPCDGQPPLLYGLNFTTPGVGWHRYLCTDHCYDTPTGASVRNPGESHDIADPQVVQERPRRLRARVQVWRGIHVSVRAGTLILMRVSGRQRRTIRPPGGVVDFELETVGLYFAYNVRGHGRVVFVPFSRLFFG
jgi:Tol biopolymer transport system component